MEEGDKVKFELVYFKDMKRLNDMSIECLVAKKRLWAPIHWKVMALFEFMAQILSLALRYNLL